MAMKRRRSNHQELESDRLSDLPEPLLLHILSFLPTKSSIRTSLLSRRFRHLWTASPSIDLDRSDFPPGRLFVDVTNRCFFRLRDRSAPLLRLCLRTYRYPLPTKSLSKWLVSANSKGLRHLSLHIDQDTIQSVLPLILSFRLLESLFIENLRSLNLNPYPTPSLVPETFSMIHLKSLHFSAQLKCSELSRLVTEQRNLEYLCYQADLERDDIVELSSPTVKILKQDYLPYVSVRYIILSFPNVELLDLSVRVHPSLHFHVQMPSLRKAIIKIYSIKEGCGPVFCDLLRSIVNVEELDLHIETLYPDTKKHVIPGARRKRKQKEEYPFHPFVDSGREKDMPIFHNLKSFKLSMCFHELSIEDLVCLLHNTPVLESLQLVHVTHTEYWESNKSDRWISKLPLNSEGNNEHCDFSDLHISDNKAELMKKLLCKEKLSKKPTIL
ncbi:hypothetical protein LUZ60_005873 [Juncus effusus]|nr:hypothetical protein LUZ60_005873 [Juncus effusus]